MTSITASDIGFILGILGILGVIFTIWKNIQKPQEDLELKQVVANKDLDNKATILAAKEMENKAQLLAQQVTLQKEAYDKKFAEIGIRLDTLDSKMVDLITASGIWHLDISKLLVELSTKLDERLPRKV